MHKEKKVNLTGEDGSSKVIWAVIALFVFIIAIVLAGGSNTSQITQQRDAINDTEYIIEKEAPLYKLEAPINIDNITFSDDFKYNYRTGYTGNYNYNYDIEGYGDYGYVYGNVDIYGKYGEGYIYDDYGNEIWIETEWIDHGLMEAYDEHGNWYELEVY